MLSWDVLCETVRQCLIVISIEELCALKIEVLVRTEVYKETLKFISSLTCFIMEEVTFRKQLKISEEDAVRVQIDLAGWFFGIRNVFQQKVVQSKMQEV